MTTSIDLTIPHQLGRAEARRRIEAGFEKVIQQVPGVGRHSQEWDGDRLVFRVASMGQTVAGVVDVRETDVTMRIDLPGVLGLIAGAFRGRLAQAGQRLLTKG